MEQALQPSITWLNMSGDVTITWDATNRERILALVREKMNQGYTFFILKPRAFKLLGQKKVKLTDPAQRHPDRAHIPSPASFALPEVGLELEGAGVLPDIHHQASDPLVAGRSGERGNALLGEVDRALLFNCCHREPPSRPSEPGPNRLSARLAGFGQVA